MFIKWLTIKSDTHFESMVSSFSFASTEKCDSVVELLAESSTSGGRDFDTTIKFNASKGEEFDTGVALDAKLVCFASSSLFSRDHQATVGSLFRIVHYCRIIHYCWMHRERKPWRRVWSISSHLHLLEQSNTKIPRLPRDLLLQRCVSRPWWILPQGNKDV